VIPTLDPEDEKIVTLARAAMARTSARAGACVRDTDGRTYSGASVRLPSLRLDALSLAVAQASSAGATGLEAAAWVSEDEPPVDGITVLRELGGKGTLLLVAGPRPSAPVSARHDAG
jgi:hypothetical protein